MSDVKFQQLPVGSMPTVGLGMWKIPKEACEATVVAAVKAGYRHFDCAADYGNEVEVGHGIARAISERLVTREELWITSKLWCTYHAQENVEPACKRTLADLGLSYVDLYLVHFPISLKFVPHYEKYPPEWLAPGADKMQFEKAPVHQTWAAMEKLVGAGLTKNIGVANWNCSGLRDLLSYAVIPPAVNQVELHPHNQQGKLLRFCTEAGIQVTGFSPLGSGSYVELGGATPEDSALAEPEVLRIAAVHGKTAAQIMLRWALQRGTSVVPKSVRPERLVENISLFDFALSDEDMAAITAIDKGRRFNDPGVFGQFMGAFVPIYE